ncbi:YtfJ family protein [Mesoterricola silvestris]|uniref:Transcriptional regulator n=1 Tax=Mesoterricola silvestris TaxID=2927979 RepID=A0AA48GHW7_9BACT|nr:YtfJ family protein [Mesoterricola silvestris]BDU71289.1 transcriptional regulator [Mesoterricola silvestris]
MIRAAALALLALGPILAGIPVGTRLPEAHVADKGLLVLDGKAVTYHPWKASATNGRVRTIYHLAARMGIDDINKPYIDALIAAKLPERLPDSPYKTVTVLNLSEANWVTHGIGVSRLEKNQRDTPYALFVADEKGAARAAWGLAPGTSAVIVLDRDGTVLFFKEGRLSPEEIRMAVGIIQERLGR